MDVNTIIILILVPIISAIIGWVTNYIAIKSLFRPYKRVRILGFTFFGIIPKRKKEISKKISIVVADYLISHKDLLEKFSEPSNVLKIKKRVMPVISEKIIENIPGMFKMVAEPIVKSVLEKEADDIIIKVGTELVEHLEETLDVSDMVYRKLLEYDTSELEKIILSVSKAEFKHIEVLGAIIGFVVGLVQVGLFLLLN